jgi:hypothetical protein
MVCRQFQGCSSAEGLHLRQCGHSEVMTLPLTRADFTTVRC